MTVLHPHRGFYTTRRGGGEVNNDSLVVKISGKMKSFVFTGDIEGEAEDDLVHLGPALKSAVLKVPHHGSRSALHEGFLRALSPEAAVISAGRSNIYGFPHREVLDALAGAEVYRTDRDGAVLIGEGAGERLLVKTWKDCQLTEAHGLAQEALNLERLLCVWP